MKSRSDEENYAERIGRNMWRMAKRRAQGALLLGRPLASALGVKCGDIAQSPQELRRQGPEDAAAGPRDLSEFLQELGEELEQDDPPPSRW